MQVADRSIALKRRQKTSLIGAKEKPLAKLVDNYLILDEFFKFYYYVVVFEE